MKKTILVMLGLALLSIGFWTPVAQERPFQVITHPDNSVGSLSKTQVSKILLKKVRKWDNGQQVQPVDQGGKGSVREAFTKAIHGRSVSSIKRFWQRQVFSGSDVPPPELGSDREVVDYVRQTPGAIGYVSSGASIDGVKVLDVTE